MTLFSCIEFIHLFRLLAFPHLFQQREIPPSVDVDMIRTLYVFKSTNLMMFWFCSFVHSHNHIDRSIVYCHSEKKHIWITHSFIYLFIYYIKESPYCLTLLFNSTMEIGVRGRQERRIFNPTRFNFVALFESSQILRKHKFSVIKGVYILITCRFQFSP